MRVLLYVLLIFTFVLLPAFVITWELSDWPEPRLVLAYGTPPAGGPTGRTLVNSVGMKMVEIGPGYFRKGSCTGCHNNFENEPFREALLAGDGCGDLRDWSKHVFAWAEVSRPFWIGATEVTIAQYHAFDPDHETYESPDDEPVVDISVEDATRYCDWLTEREPGTYRLPTVTEWRYACRGGSDTEFSCGPAPDRLCEHAWYYDNGRGRVHPAAGKEPNAWGLFDMHGNATEWCEALCPYVYGLEEWDGGSISLEHRAQMVAEAERRIQARMRRLEELGERPPMFFPTPPTEPVPLGGSAFHFDYEAATGYTERVTVPDYARGFRVVMVKPD